MFLHLRMNLAYKKILGKFTKKVLGFGKTPPPSWEKFPNNIVFFLWERTLSFVNLSICLRWEKSDEGGLSKAICASCTNLHNWSVLVHAFYSIQSNLLPNNKNTTPVQWYTTFTLEIKSHLKTRWNWTNTAGLIRRRSSARGYGRMH